MIRNPFVVNALLIGGFIAFGSYFVSDWKAKSAAEPTVVTTTTEQAPAVVEDLTSNAKAGDAVAEALTEYREVTMEQVQEAADEVEDNTKDQ